MTWPVVTMGVPAWSHLLHLKPITFFPHFTGRLCHFWHIIQRRRRPVGKPVRQKSPLGRLIFLVIVIIIFRVIVSVIFSVIDSVIFSVIVIAIFSVIVSIKYVC